MVPRWVHCESAMKPKDARRSWKALEEAFARPFKKPGEAGRRQNKPSKTGRSRKTPGEEKGRREQKHDAKLTQNSL